MNNYKLTEADKDFYFRNLRKDNELTKEEYEKASPLARMFIDKSIIAALKGAGKIK